MSVKIYDFRFNLSQIDFEICGLDKNKNVIQAPDCPCGCGSKMELVLQDEKDIENYCLSEIKESLIDKLVVFVMTSQNELYIGVGAGEDVYVYKAIGISNDYTAMGRLVDDYADGFELLVQTSDDSFRIVEE